MSNSIKAYLIGGGIGSLSAAAFMIRDAGVDGRNITILEAMPLAGGSLDGGGNPDGGYTLRGGRMLTTDNYECTWDLFKSIPSLEHEGQSVYDETIAFNELHQSHSQARLVDRNRFKVDVTSMGFSMQDRVELLRLSETDEDKLGGTAITDWLSPEFFDTKFWYMWATTFAFQPWHSAVEFKRYLHRFMMEFSRIETLAGVKRTVYNQYDSLVRPLQHWLQQQGVQLVLNCKVDDLELSEDGDAITVTAIHCRRDGEAQIIRVRPEYLVFFQNGSMTDASSYGSMYSAPPKLDKRDSQGWALWEKLAARRPQFGNPAAFNSSIPESWWESFTVTLQEPVEDLPAVLVDREHIADQEVDAVAVRDQQRVRAQAADVFLALEHEFGIAAVGLHRPGAGRGEAGHAGDDRQDLGHEFAPVEFFGHQRADSAAAPVRGRRSRRLPCRRRAPARCRGRRLDREGAHRRITPTNSSPSALVSTSLPKLSRRS
jgi:myosin-crossreactive antigen